MKKYLFVLTTLISVFLWSACQNQGEGQKAGALKEKAQQLVREAIIVDTHIDVPFRVYRKDEDISRRTQEGHFDYPRARQGGLDAAFMSVFVPASYQEKGGAKALADSLIDLVDSFENKWPDKFTVVTSPDEVKSRFGSGKMMLALGMENGAPVENDLKNIQYFYDRGIRYITLAHSKNNHISDSSYDDKPKWNGLSPFGRKVVREMNRVGIMVDVSHITDAAFNDVMEVTRAPVIASHSSCRYFTPGFERNMSDEMIEKLARNGGVIQVSFGSYFVHDAYRKQYDTIRDHIRSYLNEHNYTYGDSTAQAYIKRYYREHEPEPGTVAEIADHIEHVIQLVGVDYVGLGSDFDGVRSLPEGMEDVSKYPNLIYELLKRGYSEADIRKICGENLLRVWREVETTARQLRATP